jgi:CTP synthase (UTP-ammonia lyase)
MPLSVAKQKAAHLQVQYDSGINPNEAKRQSRAEPSLDVFFDIYYEDRCRVKAKHRKAIKVNYNRYLKSTLGSKQLFKIEREEVHLVQTQEIASRPELQRWFATMQARPAFTSAVSEWIPAPVVAGFADAGSAWRLKLVR